MRLFLDDLGASPPLGSGGTLSILIDFGDATREFVTSTGLLFPLDLDDWTSAGFAVREFVPGVGLETKLLGRVQGWQVVPEPATAGLLGAALALLGARAAQPGDATAPPSTLRMAPVVKREASLAK